MDPESWFNTKRIRRQLFSDRNYAKDLVPWEFAIWNSFSAWWLAIPLLFDCPEGLLPAPNVESEDDVDQVKQAPLPGVLGSAVATGVPCPAGKTARPDTCFMTHRYVTWKHPISATLRRNWSLTFVDLCDRSLHNNITRHTFPSYLMLFDVI